jgi:hypothetical protein
VATVHAPLDPNLVYDLWKDPPRRIKNRVLDPLPSKASIESFQQAGTLGVGLETGGLALKENEVMAAVNLRGFWEPANVETLRGLVEKDLDESMTLPVGTLISAIELVLSEKALLISQYTVGQSLKGLGKRKIIERLE